MVQHLAEKAVSIVGLGYVGLPLAVLCAEKKFSVSAIDIDRKKIELINKGICPLKDKHLEMALSKVKLQATPDFSRIKDTDIVVVCVPTPVDHKYNPDLRPLKSACEPVQQNLRKDHLVIIESTINPGVCEEVVLPILEKSGLQCGVDFHLAHCPERIDPGNKSWNVRNIPRVVGSTSKLGLHRALLFYQSIIEAQITPMCSIKEAEATKIVENTFRDINIAFVNELAKSFDKLGIDIMEVIKGASTKPFAFMPHYPGCGVGGHCIPVDPYYLIEHARKNGFDHKLLRLAREINNGMPNYTVDLLVEMLNKLEKSVKGTRVGVLGISYKRNVADDRESPSYEIIKHLKKREAKVIVYDPNFPEKSDVKSLSSFLHSCEAVILCCNHDEFMRLKPADFENAGVKVLIDGRNSYKKTLFAKSSVLYKGIGTISPRKYVKAGKMSSLYIGASPEPGKVGS
jgi:nucleotide sugar dehydrogenase